jgi:glyoxylase-like metal-dependent hydrolase (beta-lactamase superfamily II)
VEADGGLRHAPEHASLYCGELKVLISGDMLLPRISTNVAVRPIDPGSNPLRLFLESIRRYRELPEDILVLPSHGLPFRGAHARVAQLEGTTPSAGRASAACAESPRAAAEVLELLFKRKLDTSQIFFRHGRGDRAPALPALRWAAGAPCRCGRHCAIRARLTEEPWTRKCRR